MKEKEVMKRLYEEYTESLEKLMKRIEAVDGEQKKYHAKSVQYKTLYNRKRRLMTMYEDTFRWRETVKEYIKSWEK